MTFLVEARKSIQETASPLKYIDECDPIALVENPAQLDGAILLEKMRYHTHFIVQDRETNVSFNIYFNPLIFDEDYCENTPYPDFALDLHKHTKTEKRTWEEMMNMFYDAKYEMHDLQKPVCLILANDTRHYPTLNDMILNEDGTLVPMAEAIRPEYHNKL